MRAISSRRSKRTVLAGTAFAVAVLSVGRLLALGPAPHHVTRFEAEKIAVSHLLQPDEREHVRIEAKLVRQWQLTLVSPNDGGNGWSNDLIWLVLVPGGHFSVAGPCCSPPPTFRWNVAIINDKAGSAGLDGVIAGAAGERSLWYRLLPDLSGGQ